MPHKTRGPLEVLSTSTFQLLTILYGSSEQGGSLPKPWGRPTMGEKKRKQTLRYTQVQREARSEKKELTDVIAAHVTALASPMA